MAKVIRLRRVPAGLLRKLEARAAWAGLSLSDYLIRELRGIVGRPTIAELQARILRRAPVATHETPVEAIRAERGTG